MSDKLGLALSGGGFRASLFHIGVLARLADLGLLRRVEVISTVSGGSIVGALYYLYVRELLQRKSDEDIADGDYQDAVERLLEHFLRVVQTNLRMRTFESIRRNWKMIHPGYSRADSIGELFDRHFYRPAFGGDPDKMVQMREIKVTPLKGGRAQQDFKPRTGNAERLARVPIILINATDLNSGHNWRFEASRMGEPGREAGADLEVDANLRLERPDSYADVVKTQQDVEVGLAVGASAAVPGLFPPLALSGLYPGVRVQLADGGVHDNQGVQGLIDPGVKCTHFVVSDASGPLQDEDEPDTGSIGVVRRSSDVQFDRIREEQVIRLIAEHGDKAAYMHLRTGLEVRVLSYNRAEGRPQPLPQPPRHRTASFGIAPEVQELLSRVRTDLDSFTDIEAYSLMLDGYNMSALELEALRATLGADPAPEEKRVRGPRSWRFLQIAPWAANGDKEANARYLRHLKVASQRFFKPFRLSTPLLLAGLVGLAAALVALYVWQRDNIHALLNQPVWTLLVVLGAIALGWVAPKLWKMFEALRGVRHTVDYLKGLGAMFLAGLVGALVVRVYLATVDRIFLWLGRVERLK